MLRGTASPDILEPQFWSRSRCTEISVHIIHGIFQVMSSCEAPPQVHELEPSDWLACSLALLLSPDRNSFTSFLGVLFCRTISALSIIVQHHVHTTLGGPNHGPCSTIHRPRTFSQTSHWSQLGDRHISCFLYWVHSLEIQAEVLAFSSHASLLVARAQRLLLHYLPS